MKPNALPYNLALEKLKQEVKDIVNGRMKYHELKTKSEIPRSDMVRNSKKIA